MLSQLGTHAFNKAGQIENEFSGNQIVIKKAVIVFCFSPFIFSKSLFTLKIKDLTTAMQLHQVG